MQKVPAWGNLVFLQFCRWLKCQFSALSYLRLFKPFNPKNVYKYMYIKYHSLKIRFSHTWEKSIPSLKGRFFITFVQNFRYFGPPFKFPLSIVFRTPRLTLRRPGRQAWIGFISPLNLIFFFRKQVLLSKHNGFHTIILQKKIWSDYTLYVTTYFRMTNNHF